MEVRPLLPHDGRAYADLRVLELEEHVSALPLPRLQAELECLALGPDDVIRNYVTSGTIVWGVFDRLTLAGAMAVSRRFSARLHAYLWLWGLFVRPHHRGTPAARLLISAAVRWCEAHPPEQRVFGAFDSRSMRAHRFCERHGFLRVEARAALPGLELLPGETLVEHRRAGQEQVRTVSPRGWG